VQRGEFNPDRLKQRAINKYERDKAHDVVVAAITLKKELTAIAGMERIALWLEKKKITLKVKKMEFAIYFADIRQIHLSGGLSRERQLIFLIHECGHVLVGRPKRNERFGMTEILKGERCTFRHRLDVLEEEFEAWHRGKKMAKRLKVVYDSTQWDQEKQWALVSYLKWAVGRGEWNDGDYSDMRVDSGNKDT
jgi:hypothetical protein